jgi:hypothetical protein
MNSKLSKFCVFGYLALHFLINPIIQIFTGYYGSLLQPFADAFLGPFNLFRYGYRFSELISSFIWFVFSYFTLIVAILILVKGNEQDQTVKIQIPPGILD